jgi:hypothetical protein
MTCATPLCRDGTAGLLELIWANREAEYFCHRGWTAKDDRFARQANHVRQARVNFCRAAAKYLYFHIQFEPTRGEFRSHLERSHILANSGVTYVLVWFYSRCASNITTHN